MSKKIKLLLVSLLCIILCASVLTSCDFEDDLPQDTQDKSEVSIDQVYAYAQEAGYTGTLEELIEAFKGDSAYQIAVKNGYTGSEADWLNTLIGASGKDGRDGKDGITPMIGYNGNWFIGGTDTGVCAVGKDGEDGKDGVNGTNGINGKDGTNGSDGNGIDRIDKTATVGNTDTYTIYFTNGTSVTFEIENGITPVMPTVEIVFDTQDGEITDYKEETLSELENGVYVTTLREGQALISLPTPQKDGYIFKGWFTGFSASDKQWNNRECFGADTELTAWWELATYSITYELDGGEFDGENPAEYTIETTPFTLINPTKVGYEFIGWQEGDSEEYLMNTTIQETFGDKVFTAKWKVETPLYTRVNVNNQEDANGDYILFGSYPQSEVTDATLKTTLNNIAGDLPTESDSKSWTSYKYYISGSNTADFMWYQDVTYSNEKYRGVYFINYRPSWTSYSSSASNSCQADNGYTTSTVYWFKYEPIKWRILEEEGGYATVLAELILDSQDYNYTDDSRTIDGKTVYSNNYAYSSIRAWLNDTFYNTAFNKLQKALIQTVEVDNSARSTNPDNNATYWNSGNNSYACANTQDKVWLLSMQEATKESYGFATSPSYDTARCKQATAYSKCQGSFIYPYWYIRSPHYSSDDDAWYFGHQGDCMIWSNVSTTDGGIVPALKIKLA